MSNILFVFAKEPRPGRVKTRLRLSESRCMGLYKAFLKDTLALIKSLKGARKIIAFDSFSSRPQYLEKIGRGFIFYRQKGRNLGERMLNAFRHAKKAGGTRTLIVGSDSPNLPQRYIGDAFGLLEDSDIVLGPSADGGYYLIGMKEPSPGIFRGVRWSGAEVFGETMANARKLGKKIALLPEWYDIDCPRGLSRLRKDLKRRKRGVFWTRRFLRA